MQDGWSTSSDTVSPGESPECKSQLEQDKIGRKCCTCNVTDFIYSVDIEARENLLRE